MHSLLILVFDLLQLLLLTSFSYAVGLCKHRHLVLLTKPSPKIKVIDTTAPPAENWTLVSRLRWCVGIGKWGLLLVQRQRRWKGTWRSKENDGSGKEGPKDFNEEYSKKGRKRKRLGMLLLEDDNYLLAGFIKMCQENPWIPCMQSCS